MKFSLLGTVNRPALVLIGTWDPFTDTHRRLVEQASCHAAQTGQCCVTVIVDPNPSCFMHEPPAWTVYDGLSTRCQFLQKSGSMASVMLEFASADLSFAADEFFHAVQSHFEVSEVWLGADQSLGSGHRGSGRHLDAVAKSCSVQIHRMPKTDIKATAARARSLLAAGSFVAASKLIGRPPVWDCSESRELSTSWPQGPCAFQEFCMESAKAIGPKRLAYLSSRRSNSTELVTPEVIQGHVAFVEGRADSNI